MDWIIVCSLFEFQNMYVLNKGESSRIYFYYFLVSLDRRCRLISLDRRCRLVSLDSRCRLDSLYRRCRQISLDSRCRLVSLDRNEEVKSVVIYLGDIS